MNQKGFKISQYACAVLLIVSSIALVGYQVVEINDVAAVAGSTFPGIPSASLAATFASGTINTPHKV